MWNYSLSLQVTIVHFLSKCICLDSRLFLLKDCLYITVMVAMWGVALDGGKCSLIFSFSTTLRVSNHTSGSFGRWIPLPAAQDEQGCSAALAHGAWCRMIDPPTWEKRKCSQTPPFPSILDLASAKYVSSERTSGREHTVSEAPVVCVRWNTIVWEISIDSTKHQEYILCCNVFI